MAKDVNWTGAIQKNEEVKKTKKKTSEEDK